MENTQTKKTLTLIIFAIIIGVLLACGIASCNAQYHSTLQNINKKFAGKMTKCWEEVQETGQTCHLEYVYVDGNQTPVSAKIIKK